MSMPRNMVLAVVIVVISLCVYLPQLNNTFLYDDYQNMRVVGEQGDRSFVDYFKINDYQHYIPYNQLLNRLLYDNLPLEPKFFRLVNLSLFLAAALLMFFLCLLLTEKQDVSFWATLFFALHPLNVMLLNHIFVSFVLLFAVFFLASFICFIFFDKTSRSAYLWLSILFFVNAQLCLEFYVVLPIAMFFYLVTLCKRPIVNSLIRLSPFFILTILHTVFWIKFVAHGSSFLVRVADLNLTAFTFVSSFSRLAHWFTAKVFYPDGIVYIYNIWPLKMGLEAKAYFSLAVIELLLLLYLLIFHSRRDKRVFYLLMFAAGFIPSAISSLGHSYMGMVFEPYWMYVPTIGILILGSDFLHGQFLSRILSQAARTSLLIAVCVYLLAFSTYYIRIGKTELGYYTYWNKSSPKNYIALTNLAQQYFKKQEEDKALRYYNEAIDSLLDQKLYPPVIAYYDISQIYVGQGKYDEAEAILNRLVSIDPQNPNVYFTLGRIDLARGNTQSAENNLYKAVTLNEVVQPALLTLMDLYLEQGQTEKIYALFQQMLKKHNGIDLCFLLLQKLNEKQHYTTGLEVFEREEAALMKHNDFYLLKGIFLANLLKYERALDVWREGLKIAKDDKRLLDAIDQTERILR